MWWSRWSTDPIKDTPYNSRPELENGNFLWCHSNPEFVRTSLRLYILFATSFNSDLSFPDPWLKVFVVTRSLCCSSGSCLCLFWRCWSCVACCPAALCHTGMAFPSTSTTTGFPTKPIGSSHLLRIVSILNTKSNQQAQVKPRKTPLHWPPSVSPTCATTTSSWTTKRCARPRLLSWSWWFRLHQKTWLLGTPSGRRGAKRAWLRARRCWHCSC